MGTTAILRLAGAQPDYVESSLNCIIALGPVLVPTHAKSMIIKVATFLQDYLYDLLTFLGVVAFG